MSQHDMDVANQAGAAFRADMNLALQALASNSSGSAAPTTTFAYQFWADTNAGLLRIRNAANTAWIALGMLGVPNLGHLLPGSVVYHAKSAAPAGFLKANGGAVSRTTYADLFAEIGTTFGAGDGSLTFNVPDLRGEFLRGWDDSRGVDSGRTFGSFEGDLVKSHYHNLRITSDSAGQAVRSGAGGTATDNASIVQMKGNDASTVFALYAAPDGSNMGSENRPRNIALLACIKY